MRQNNWTTAVSWLFSLEAAVVLGHPVATCSTGFEQCFAFPWVKYVLQAFTHPESFLGKVQYVGQISRHGVGTSISTYLWCDSVARWPTFQSFSTPFFFSPIKRFKKDFQLNINAEFLLCLLCLNYNLWCWGCNAVFFLNFLFDSIIVTIIDGAIPWCKK